MANQIDNINQRSYDYGVPYIAIRPYTNDINGLRAELP